jgi:hypothetical protein
MAATAASSDPGAQRISSRTFGRNEIVYSVPL